MMKTERRKKLFNEHGDREWGKRRMIGGNTTNLIQLNNVKYEWATKMYRAMMNNFWIPEEIPLAQDAKDYKLLIPIGTHKATIKSLAF